MSITSNDHYKTGCLCQWILHWTHILRCSYLVQSNFITHYPPGVVIVIILLGGSSQAFSEIPQQCCLLEASDVAPRDRGWATEIPEPIDQGQGWLAKEDRFPWCYFNAFAIELLFVIVQHDMKDHVSHIPQLITEILYPVPKRVKLIYEYRSFIIHELML